MKVSSRPLLDNAVDAAQFVGRAAEIAAVCNGLNAQLNVLVTGNRGAGRTSLLRYLQHVSRTGKEHHRLIGDFPMSFVRVEGITDGIDLLSRIVRAVTGTDISSQDPAVLLSELADHRQRHMAEIYKRWIEESGDENAAEGSRLLPVIIVDDVTASAGHALFGQLRDEVWSTDYLWVVAVRDADRGGLLLPPADAFFDTVVELGPLTPTESAELLDRRGGADLGAISTTLVEAIPGNPRDLVAALRTFLQDPESYDVNVKAIGNRDDAIHKLGRPAAMLAAELKARGPVSASDEHLLSALGWTRPRAVQVLKQLADNGLVTSHERAAGPGRPRRMYALSAPAEWMRHQADLRDVE